jgi:putative NIF3 family GTP cyclohydrolase 1 type 2
MSITIRTALERLEELTGGKPEHTVDGLLSGDPSTPVAGIAVAFMPSHATIEKAIACGANLLIAHEGVFYSHRDAAERLNNDEVCMAKRRLIERSGIAVYRCHDGWHRRRPDGIAYGLIETLGWTEFVESHQMAASILTLPPTTVGEAAARLKRRLGVPMLRVVGDLAMPCRRVGLLVGYRGGGDTAIPLLEQERLDLVVAGEGPEWETPEYVRDAVRQGRSKALILLGHAASEEPGMAFLAERLQVACPEVPVRYLRDEPLFQWI